MAMLKVAQKESDKKPTRYYSKKQETSIAKSLTGKVQKNSGATMFAKGDVLTKKFLLEAKTKTTHAESITIKKEWFEKNTKETLVVGKPYSAVVFNFGPDEENHYIISEELFEMLLEYLENN